MKLGSRMKIGKIGSFESIAAINDGLSCILRDFLNQITDISKLIFNILIYNKQRNYIKKIKFE